MKLDDFLKLSKDDLKGKIICFPTDTVYGIGCMIDDLDALNKIYELKHRDKAKPLACLAPNINAITPYVLPFNKDVENILNTYWPGALTVIFNKSNNVSDLLTCGLPSIGLRMPNSVIALKVLNKVGLMATTSVNISGEAPLNDIEEIKKIFASEIDIYIDDICEFSGVSSTVIDCTKDEIKVLRQGLIKIK